MTRDKVNRAESQPNIDFWFDPACPWAWMTSRWMTNVIELRGIEVRWHVLSLAVLNEGRDLPEDYREHIDRTWLAARAIVGAAQQYSPQIIKPLYDEIGTRFHPGGRGGERAAVVEAFEALELDLGIVERAETDEFDAAMRESTRAALDLVGDDVGVPVVAIDGKAYFGPVVTPAPKGQEALDMFDGLVALTRVSGFYEIKKTREQGPVFD